MNKRMAIISSYFEGESYGILGPQIAATIIQDNTEYECIVIAVTRNDDKESLKKNLAVYFGNQRPIIGFSSLSGREDLFSFARELKDDGAITILAGPQAFSDYIGEKNWKEHPYRFNGLSDCVSYSLHGPAEQVIQLLNGLNSKEWTTTSGLLFIDKNGSIIHNPQKVWDEKYLRSVKWDNLYRTGERGLVPLHISIGQVLQQIGCPYASREKWVEIDYPASIKGQKMDKKVSIVSKGCSFCDVAIDKGFYGELNMQTVLDQILCLPEDYDGRKIPFELINENPLPKLNRLLLETKTKKIKMSQINLILRADWFLKGEARLKEALGIARNMGVRIFLSSMGFEAFDDRLLKNFNKGIDVETNLKAIRLMRRLKEDFPKEWGYSKTEGAIHGFIHPTPWDTKEAFANTQKNIAIYGLERDILPPNSTPLIIHHASALGDWIRQIEQIEGVHYKRYGSIIGWWKEE